MAIIKNKYFHFILLVLAVVVVYSNGFHSPFQYDDKHVIQWNRTVKNISNLPNILTGTGRPLLKATFALNYYWFGEQTLGYNAFNIMVHVLNCILIYILMNLTFKDRGVSLLAGLLFAVHPLNTQAVNYISARSTSLVTVFFLLSVILFMKANTCGEKRNKNLLYAGTFICCLLGLGTKEVAVSIPVMLFAYHYVFFKGGIKRFVRKYWMFILLAGGYLLYRLINSGTIGDYSTQRELVPTVLTNFNAMVYENLKLLFFPVNLNIAYEFPVTASITLPVVFSMGIVILLLIVSLKTVNNLKYLSFSILWFFIALLPTQTLVPREEIICEHRLYLAGVSVCMLLAVSLSRLKKMKFSVIPGKTATGITFMLTVLLLGFLAVRSYNRNIDWQSEVRIWEKMAENFPASSKANSNLGNSYAERGMYKKAAQHYEIILNSNPDDSKVNNNLANIYYLTGMYDKAVKSYRKAISLSPGYITAYNNLAMTFEKKDMPDEALKVYRKALGISPGNPSTHFRIGNVLQKKKDYNNAINAYRKAVELRPDYAWAYNNMGNAYFYRGLYEKALESYRKAIALDPGLKQAKDNIVLARERIKK